MSRKRSLKEIQEDIRTLTRVPSEFIHAKLDELAEEIGELARPKWIPCNERKPKGTVLCCDDRGNMLVGLLCEDEVGYMAYGDDGQEMYNCVAWMPLPEPYKGEGKDAE